MIIPRLSKEGNLVKEALEENPHVPGYLLRRKRLPCSFPPYITWGGEDEAIAYVIRFSKGWQQTRGGLDWLAEQMA